MDDAKSTLSRKVPYLHEADEWFETQIEAFEHLVYRHGLRNDDHPDLPTLSIHALRSLHGELHE